MDIKKLFYTLNKEKFNEYLSSLKNQEGTIRLFSDEKENYFYYPEEEINNKLLILNKKQWEFDSLLNSFSNFSKSQIIQSFFS